MPRLGSQVVVGSELVDPFHPSLPDASQVPPMVVDYQPVDMWWVMFGIAA